MKTVQTGEKPVTANDGPSNSFGDHCSDRRNDTARLDVAQGPDFYVHIPSMLAFLRSRPAAVGRALFGLMALHFMSGKPVPNDDKAICDFLPCTLPDWLKVKAAVLAECEVTDAGIVPDVSMLRATNDDQMGGE